MVNKIKDIFSNLFKSRVAVVSLFMAILSFVLIGRIFYLQIINGSEYLENYTLRIQKERTIEGTRGNIYDRNGELLAYNELAYSVTFEDTGAYTKSETLNQALYEIIQMIESNGDSIDNDFNLVINDAGELEFNVSGSTLNRFLADIYGHSYISELVYNKKLGYDEATATPQQVYDYLKDRFKISDDYNTQETLKLIVVRYAMSLNSYQKYITTTIASDVSDETVAKIEENKSSYSGLDIEEDTVRVYDSSEYFAQIIGYTGKISTDEYNELVKTDDSYTVSDTIGKSGIEQYMESNLRGTNGYEELYVDNVGNILQVGDSKESSAGNDVYLTLDKNLQVAVYNLLERELASVLYGKIQNVTNYDVTEATSASDIIIPIDDVYYALINNNVLDINTFSDDDAGSTEKFVYAAYTTRESSVISQIKSELSSGATIYNDCSADMQEYQTYLMSLLYDKSVVDKASIDTTSDEYAAWKDGSGSLKNYLEYLISNNYLDTSYLTIDSKYADLSEIYDALITYVEDQLLTDTDFHKLIYKYMIKDGSLSGTSVCLMLFEQGVLKDEDGTQVSGLNSGATSAYTFIREKIKNLEITPAQLALDPCNASSVIVDPNTGQLLACVTYPGYDNNKLANTVDSDYYSQLVNDLSNPQYNFATQQKTAPGSTFKMVTATAALTEGYLSSVEETVTDEGVFEKIADGPKCWIYPSSTHGTINVSEAIRDSCNYFFYEMGWRMSTSSGTYNDETGLSVLSKYAGMYGLDSTTGIEINEASPQISDEDAVRSAIGQGTNNYTTTQLARYVATVANKGTCYNLSLISKVTDSSGNVIEEFSPTVYNELNEVSDTSWSAIHAGMQMVVQNIDAFDSSFTDNGITVSGKTGTAQESKKRANHALFVSFASDGTTDQAQIAMATRIPFGYTSANAAEVSSYILKYYYNLDTYENLSQSILSGSGSSYISD